MKQSNSSIYSMSKSCLSSSLDYHTRSKPVLIQRRHLLNLSSILVITAVIMMNLTQASDFCFTLCNNGCSGPNPEQCNRCINGFQKKSNNYCVTEIYNQFSQNDKWQPIGKSDDITYNLQSNQEVKDLIVTSTTTSAQDNCDIYNFYGRQDMSDTVTIEYPGTDAVRMYQVRIVFWMITINNWNDDQKIKVEFVPSGDQNVNNLNMDHTHTICSSGGGRKQGYKVIDNSFPWTDAATQLTFELTIQNQNDDDQLWGIKNVIVMAKMCHDYCQQCTGPKNDDCSRCVWDPYYAWLSGTTCEPQCLDGYGLDNNNIGICVQCEANCKSCLNMANNCTVCQGNYYLITDQIAGTTLCVDSCPDTHFIDNSFDLKTCSPCEQPCLKCKTTKDTCTDCADTVYLYNSQCLDTCIDGTWPRDDPVPQSCIDCNSECSMCSDQDTCTACTLSGNDKAFLLGIQCLKECGVGYYQDYGQGQGQGPNTCQQCDQMCYSCDINSTYCNKCKDTYYLFELEMTCNTDCIQPTYFPDNATWKCLECEVYCVRLQTKLYFPDELKTKLFYDLTFSQKIDWDAQKIKEFVTITTDDSKIKLDFFFITATKFSQTRFRIQLSPRGYIFLYNVTFTFRTKDPPSPVQSAINGYPFYQDSVYRRQDSIMWMVIVAPSLTEVQTTLVQGMSKISDQISSITTAPVMQEIKKSGVFGMLLGGAQATSLSILINNVPSQNCYEGARFWGSFVFFDVPRWEEDASKTKYMLVPSVQEIVKDARLLLGGQSNSAHLKDHLNIPQESFESHPRKLFDTSEVDWRFQRTGSTSFFIFDCYMNVFLIALCWGLLIFGQCYFKGPQKKKSYTLWMSRFYSFTHRVHEISVFYISLATMLEWMYFDASSYQRWLSMALCMLFNLYFLAYQLYIYYDMIGYPRANIGNEHYNYYVLKYGSLLKNIRFEEFDSQEQWSCNHWLRPYNFHILSYYKRFLMLIALPIFYDIEHAQISVLMLIQFLEILRLIFTWPFKTLTRNLIRLALDTCLLAFFTTVLMQGFFMTEIMRNNDLTLIQSIDMFYKVGWVGFCLIFVFNISYLALFIFDVFIGCKVSNRQLMDETRKAYYMQKLNTFQQENEDVPIGLINKWVKLGNLNNRRYEDLPDINIRIEYFRVLKTSNGFQIDLKKLSDLSMNIQFNYNQENNITAAKKVNRRFTLTRMLSPDFFGAIEGLYKQYSQSLEFQYLTLKTFQTIIQSSLKPGENIPVRMTDIFQRVELETYSGQTKVFKLANTLNGFPIEHDNLRKIL